MAVKAVLFVCAMALMLESISAQCCAHAPAPCGAPAFAPASGGSFPVTSYSPLAPTGIFVQSDNEYTGDLSICGGVPFLATVSLEGSLPTSGTGAINYGCGNGDIAILSENTGAAGMAPPCGCGRPAYY